MNLNFSDFASVGAALFQPAQGQVYADLAGELAILNSKTGIYYGLDPVGARVWSLILEYKSVREIKETLLDEYDVASKQLECDLLTLLNDLSTKGLIEAVSPNSRRAAATSSGTQAG